MAVQPGLCRTRSEIQKNGFSMTRFKCFMLLSFLIIAVLMVAFVHAMQEEVRPQKDDVMGGSRPKRALEDKEKMMAHKVVMKLLRNSAAR